MNLEQRRMLCAYDLLENTGDRGKYWKTAVDGFGAEVQRLGLLQALAFLHRGPTKGIADDFCAAVREHLVALHHLPAQAQGSFLEEVRDLQAEAYVRITLEVLALSVWLRRAGQILLQDDNPNP